MHYKEIFKALNSRKIRYLVTGGVAVNLYGVARMTMDLDLLIALDHHNKKEFYALMENLGFKTQKPSLAKKLMLGKQPPGKIKVITFFRKTSELIDVFIQSPVEFDDVYKNRKIFRAEEINIPTVPYDSLVSMKRESGRDRDLIDIGYLEKAKKLNK